MTMLFDVPKDSWFIFSRREMLSLMGWLGLEAEDRSDWKQSLGSEANGKKEQCQEPKASSFFSGCPGQAQLAVHNPDLPLPQLANVACFSQGMRFSSKAIYLPLCQGGDA